MSCTRETGHVETPRPQYARPDAYDLRATLPLYMSSIRDSVGYLPTGTFGFRGHAARGALFLRGVSLDVSGRSRVAAVTALSPQAALACVR